MTRRNRATVLATWTIAAWAMTLTSANAYVDAGSTSVIFQAIIAFLAAAGTGLAMFRQKIAGMFRKDQKASVDAPAGDTEAPDSEHV